MKEFSFFGELTL